MCAHSIVFTGRHANLNGVHVNRKKRYDNQRIIIKKGRKPYRQIPEECMGDEKSQRKPKLRRKNKKFELN